ncbi:hypothetical protein M378DRAFT_66984, partial [Amanita muscaria Koide BX008]
LDPAVIAKGFASNGLHGSGSEAGQVAALTSTNNFINFCKTVDLPITNGQQLRNGSCNPAPMGVIPSTKNMPSSKFVSPKNGGVVKAKQTFTVQMAVRNLETGNFVNPNTNYFAAPQQVSKRGAIIGHSHVVIEKLTSLDQTTLTDPNEFAFFKGLNSRAKKDILSVDVTGGLPAGAYRLSSINTAASHQAVLVPIAQRGALDDMIYVRLSCLKPVEESDNMHVVYGSIMDQVKHSFGSMYVIGNLIDAMLQCDINVFIRLLTFYLLGWFSIF